jgi:hypothetical protein
VDDPRKMAIAGGHIDILLLIVVIFMVVITIFSSR